MLKMSKRSLLQEKGNTYKISISGIDVHNSTAKGVVLRQGDPVGTGVEDGWVGVSVDIDGGCSSSLDIRIHCVIGNELHKVGVTQKSIQGH